MGNRITAHPVVRSSTGEWQHPQLPEWTTKTMLQDMRRWFEKVGITSFLIVDLLDSLDSMPEQQAASLRAEYENSHVFSKLPLVQPVGEGWFLLSVHDSFTGPVALWATCAAVELSDQDMGHGAPPRPTIDSYLIRHACAEILDGQFSDEELPTRITHIESVWFFGMTGPELCQALADEHGWDVSPAIADALAMLQPHIDTLHHHQLLAWVANHSITPDLATGRRVLVSLGNRTGTIVGLSDLQPACYLVKPDGHDDRGEIITIPYECVTALED
ncbi:hypothetical protein [Aeromonas sp. QDB22]|uniref:hypothetical protein n=1 Tax=Aeromonas sp. QDB22 TaxID=2989834 RepID=UPI0022DEC33E|nr:hypothetical protein [Aeromonas sp. QDB22]